MEKLKNRLDAFSDAIIAIIITIMVLNIPPVLFDNIANYMQLSKNIGIYLISFVFVANVWYEHSTAFGEIETMTYRILILEVVFLAFLSLIPLFTSMMAQNTTRITVILYGVLQFWVNFLFRYLAKAIIHLQYTDKKQMQQVYVKIYGNANHYLNILSVAAIVVAYFLPEVALLFYLAYPILTFLLNSAARQEMYDVGNLPEDEQEDFVNLNSSELRDFRKVQQEQAKSDAQEEKQVATTQAPATSTPAKPAAKDAAADKPQKTSGNRIYPDIGKWLDSSVDPERRRQIRQRYDNSTPEQQQRMQEWFKKRRQRMAQGGKHRNRQHQ